jgi:hypothetical protein
LFVNVYSSTQSVANIACEQISLQEERDKLLLEKAALEEAVAAASSTTEKTTSGEGEPESWKAEKAVLATERDQALEKLQVPLYLV